MADENRNQNLVADRPTERPNRDTQPGSNAKGTPNTPLPSQAANAAQQQGKAMGGDGGSITDQHVPQDGSIAQPGGFNPPASPPAASPSSPPANRPGIDVGGVPQTPIGAPGGGADNSSADKKPGDKPGSSSPTKGSGAPSRGAAPGMRAGSGAPGANTGSPIDDMLTDYENGGGSHPSRPVGRPLQDPENAPSDDSDEDEDPEKNDEDGENDGEGASDSNKSDNSGSEDEGDDDGPSRGGAMGARVGARGAQLASEAGAEAVEAGAAAAEAASAAAAELAAGIVAATSEIWVPLLLAAIFIILLVAGILFLVNIVGIAASKTDSGSSSQNTAAGSSQSFGNSNGFAFPKGSGFGASGTWSVDQGVDITAPGGTPELAIGDGTVVHHGIGGFGQWAPILKLDSPIDGKYRYVYYGHAGCGDKNGGDNGSVGNKICSKDGTKVKQGDQIAAVGYGVVGLSTGPHIEIGFSDANGTPVGPKLNPSAYDMQKYLKAHQP